MIYTVYPYRPEMSRLVSYWRMKAEDIEYAYLVCPISWGPIDGRFEKSNNVVLSNDFMGSLEKSDALVLLETSQISFMYMDLVRKIEFALEAGKVVFCYIKLADKDLYKILYMNNNNFIYKAKGSEYISNNDVIQTQDCIVLAFGDMIRGLDSSYLMAGVALEFEQRGYKVSLISKNKNLNLLSNHSELPSRTSSNEEHVTLINSYVNYIQDMQKPDIILFHFSDGMLKYSDEIHCGFGINAFIESQALSVDYFVLNITASLVLYNEHPEIEELNKLFSYRFNCGLDSIVVTNCSVSDEDSESPGDPSFETCSYDILNKRIKECNERQDMIKIHAVSDPDACTYIVDHCINVLSENISII